MTHVESLHSSTGKVVAERRKEARHELTGRIWMLDHAGCTMLPCLFEDVSGGGMLIRAPLGYGVADGNLYEVRSCDPNESQDWSDPGSVRGRLAQVRWARTVTDDRGQFVEAGLQFVS